MRTPTGGLYALGSGSPCVDVGENEALPTDAADLDWDGDTAEFLPKDLSRLDRVRNAVVDLGAHAIFSDQPPGGGDDN